MFQGSKRKFGITSNLSGLNQGIVINNLQLDQNLLSALARNEKGKILDIAVYGDDKTVSIDGLYIGDDVVPGTIIKVNNTNFVVTSTGRNEVNTAFQTANINARYFSGEDPGPGPGPGPEPIIPNPSLMFKAVLNDGASIQLNRYGSPNAVNLLYRKNNESWSTYNIGDIINLDKNDVVFLSGVNDHFSEDDENFYYFTIAGDVEASGNVMSLMNFSDTCDDYCYTSLFMHCHHLMNTPNLPATGLASHCYYNMFKYCYLLTGVPLLLPATTLYDGCYQSMFEGCSSISSIPSLPATTVEYRCYLGMFAGCTALSSVPVDLLPASAAPELCYCWMFGNCTSLTVAPELPATELASYCYRSMFTNCSSLLDGPLIYATLLKAGCFEDMFMGCTSLSSLNVNFTDWGTAATGSWVLDVASAGTFYKPSALSAKYGSYWIPSGWTVVNKDQPVVDYTPLTFKGLSSSNAVRLVQDYNPGAITLDYSKNNGAWTTYNVGDVITLNQNLTVAFSGNNDHFSSNSGFYYFRMSGTIEASGNIQSLMNFSNNCTERCYNNLFQVCRQLVTAPDLPATGLAQECYWSMFADCTNLTDAPLLPATTLANGCYIDMFDNCTSLTAAPELPATTLDWGCYADMFYGCSHLSTAPYLPATSLVNWCYAEMFYNCSQLNVLSVNFTEWGQLNETQEWVRGVNNHGDFYKPYNLSTTHGFWYIPGNWTVHNK